MTLIQALIDIQQLSGRMINYHPWKARIFLAFAFFLNVFTSGAGDR